MQVFKCISDIIKGVNVENPRFLVKQMQVIKGNVLKYAFITPVFGVQCSLCPFATPGRS